MRLCDVIEVKVTLHSKVKPLLNLSTKDFFARVNTFYNSTLTTSFVDDVNHLLFLLEEKDLIITDQNLMSKSGIKMITDVKDESLITPELLEILKRKRCNVNSILTDGVKDIYNADVFLKSDNKLDVLVAAKFLSKQENAISRGVEFKLTLAQVKKLMLTKRCYYSGVVLTTKGDHRLTFDRINSKLGYVDGNVVACSKKVNTLKEELLDNGVNIDLYGKKGLKKMLTKFAELIEV